MDRPIPVSSLDIQGHRGARGLYPENTIPSFRKALEIGVTTLELDLCISKDSQVVVSHEPWFNHVISTPPSGIEINAENEMEYNLFEMYYDDIKDWDVGLKEHSGFINQAKVPAHKPLLAEVFAFAESWVKDNKREEPLYYNIEIKSRPEGDDRFHPTIDVFVQLVMDVVDKYNLRDRVVIQSFDVRPLQIIKINYPDVKLALLIENIKGPESNIETLGFIPDIYSPHYRLINTSLINYCKNNNMRLIPWTVNDAEEMTSLIHKNIDGIITDYPDILMDVYTKLKANDGL